MPRVERYLVMHNTKYMDYRGDGWAEIGKVVDTQNENETAALIMYYRDNRKVFGYHFRSARDDSETFGCKCLIVTDDLHRGLMLSNPGLFKAMCMHEIGHYLNGDLDPANHEGAYDYDRESQLRADAIIAGKVDQKELAADEFACRECGKHAVNMLIDYLIQARKERGDWSADLAIRELELRKKAIRKLRV